MILAKNKIVPTKEWQHDPALIDKDKNTVAFILACNRIIPNKNWFHSPNL